MTRADVVRALNEEYARLRDENLRRRDQRIDEVIAADPVATDSAAAPPSSAAMRFSNTSDVGFISRV